MLGIGEELGRRRHFKDLPLIHKDDAVGHFAGKTHFVGDAYHRHSRDPDYRQRQKAQCDERNQAIRDRAGYLAGLLTLSLLVIAGWSLQSFARLGVPEWVVRLLLGSWVFYLAAFFLLYKWFQRRM